MNLLVASSALTTTPGFADNDCDTTPSETANLSESLPHEDVDDNWIHRDKLAQIESRELREAGVRLSLNSTLHSDLLLTPEFSYNQSRQHLHHLPHAIPQPQPHYHHHHLLVRLPETRSPLNQTASDRSPYNPLTSGAPPSSSNLLGQPSSSSPPPLQPFSTQDSTKPSRIPVAKSLPTVSSTSTSIPSCATATSTAATITPSACTVSSNSSTNSVSRKPDFPRSTSGQSFKDSSLASNTTAASTSWFASSPATSSSYGHLSLTSKFPTKTLDSTLQVDQGEQQTQNVRSHGPSHITPSKSISGLATSTSTTTTTTMTTPINATTINVTSNRKLDTVTPTGTSRPTPNLSGMPKTQIVSKKRHSNQAQGQGPHSFSTPGVLSSNSSVNNSNENNCNGSGRRTVAKSRNVSGSRDTRNRRVGGGGGANSANTTPNGTLSGVASSSTSPSRRSVTSHSHAPPEGDPPWLAGMFKPDPRLPPDQQILPTHAKRMLQEQWEKEGHLLCTAYDTNFRPIDVTRVSLPSRLVTAAAAVTATYTTSTDQVNTLKLTGLPTLTNSSMEVGDGITTNGQGHRLGEGMGNGKKGATSGCSANMCIHEVLTNAFTVQRADTVEILTDDKFDTMNDGTTLEGSGSGADGEKLLHKSEKAHIHTSSPLPQPQQVKRVPLVRPDDERQVVSDGETIIAAGRATGSTLAGENGDSELAMDIDKMKDKELSGAVRGVLMEGLSQVNSSESIDGTIIDISSGVQSTTTIEGSANNVKHKLLKFVGKRPSTADSRGHATETLRNESNAEQGENLLTRASRSSSGEKSKTCVQDELTPSNRLSSPTSSHGEKPGNVQLEGLTQNTELVGSRIRVGQRKSSSLSRLRDQAGSPGHQKTRVSPLVPGSGIQIDSSGCNNEVEVKTTSRVTSTPLPVGAIRSVNLTPPGRRATWKKYFCCT